MSEIDAMVNQACRAPEDSTLRGALADMIREQRGRTELADAVEADVGIAILKATADLADHVSLPTSYELLWTAYAVMPRLKDSERSMALPLPPLPSPVPEIPWQPRRRPITIPSYPGERWGDGAWTGDSPDPVQWTIINASRTGGDA